MPDAEGYFFRVKNLAGVRRRAMLGAAAALDAGKGLEGDELRQVLARIEAEIFVPRERRDFAERVALQKDCSRAQNQMKMLGVRQQRQEYQDRQRVRPPERLVRFAAGQKGRQIRRHQKENQKRDYARLVR